MKTEREKERREEEGWGGGAKADNIIVKLSCTACITFSTKKLFHTVLCYVMALTFEKKRELILTRQGKIIRGKLTTTEMAKAEENGRNERSREGERGLDRSKYGEGEREGNTVLLHDKKI